jgi:hypothetical protein
MTARVVVSKLRNIGFFINYSGHAVLLRTTQRSIRKRSLRVRVGAGT